MNMVVFETCVACSGYRFCFSYKSFYFLNFFQVYIVGLLCFKKTAHLFVDRGQFCHILTHTLFKIDGKFHIS